ANPTADVEGLDAARKMVILARLSFLTDVELDDVDVEGISELSIIDLDYGKKLDLTMKLIGFANRHDQQVEVSVQPTFLSNKQDRKSTRLNSSHVSISYAVFCLKKKKE